MTVLVRNLRTLDEQVFVGIAPEDAVIAAYAQSRGDRSTWEYAKYRPMVTKSDRSLTVCCGDFCAFKTGIR